VTGGSEPQSGGWSRAWERARRPGSFTRDVGVLGTGTTLAQVVTIGVLPVLSRLYTPAQFGMFGLFMSCLSIGGLLSAGSYERAILLPAEEREAAGVFGVAMLVALLTAGLGMIAVALVGPAFSAALGTPALSGWLYWLPVGTLVIGVSEALKYWAGREQRFSLIGRARAIQMTATAAAQVALGAVRPMGGGGLILGRVGGIGLLAVLLGGPTWGRLGQALRSLPARAYVGAAARFKKFPQFVTGSAVFSQAASAAPIFIIALNFPGDTVGQFAMIQRLLSAPMQLIGDAFEQVFFQRGSAEQQRTGSPRESVERTFLYLLLLIVVPVVILLGLGRDLMVLVLGHPWDGAGRMAVWMAPLLGLSFVTAPLYPVFNLRERQELQFGFQAARIVLALGTVHLVGRATHDIRTTLLAYVAVECLMQLAALTVAFRLAGASPAGVVRRGSALWKAIRHHPAGGTSQGQ
jgi:O-antigen/teichoic acid export membrane protein